MSGFTKLDSALTASSIWNEPDPVRIVWVTMLSLADKDGNVKGSVVGLAYLARKTLPETESALAVLESPDPHSGRKEQDGRRVIPFEGGWHLVNHAFYRESGMSEEQLERTREKTRERVKRHRANEPLDSGYVYYAENQDQIKIGFSKNPWSRVHEFKTVCPAVRLLAVEKGTMGLEQQRHEKFKEFRIDREWFEASPELRAFVVSLPTVTTTNYDVTPASASGSGVASETEKGDARGKQESPLPLSLDTPQFREAWQEWQNYRREIKKPLTATSIKAQLRQFEQWGERRAVAAIQFTIQKGWQGLREDDSKPRKSKGEYPEPALDDSLVWRPPGTKPL